MTVQIHLQTSRYAPPRRVSLRPDAELPTDQYEGFHRDGCWTFEVPDEVAGSFRLVLDGMVTSPPLPHPDFPSRTLFWEADVKFSEPSLSTDCSRLQQEWFPIGADQKLWDVIVVGSGMGGGTLLYELSQKGSDKLVLGLEAGPLLLPTHAGNLARRAYADSDQITTLWGLYDQWGEQPFEVAQAGQRWSGKEIFALGGRSLFWGGLAPRMSEGDQAGWPQSVIDDLQNIYYQRAEELMNVQSPDPTDEEIRLISILEELSGSPVLRPRLAPVAIQRVDSRSWQIPGGLFSTADLILDAKLQVPAGNSTPAAENWPPYLHLSEQVTRVTPARGKSWEVADATASTGGPTARQAWTVYGVNVTDGSPTIHHAKTVVLAAGAIETARIALASKLGNPLIGQGLTEHDMWWVHFQVPENSPFYRAEQSTKLIATPPRGTDLDWNVQIELNCELNERRFVPADMRRPILRVDQHKVGGQLVFLCRNPLRPDQWIKIDPDQPWLHFNTTSNHRLPAAILNVVADDGDAPTVMQDLADRILAALDATPAVGRNDVRLQRAGRGYVAHEIGTMRMGTPPAKCVVGPDLQVLGRPGLYVCDNSVFPTCPAANPSLTLAALALRLADKLTF